MFSSFPPPPPPPRNTAAMATATSPTNPDQIDHLSALSDALILTILSLLPTRIAARTSLLSRRFRHLWKALPSLDLFSPDLGLKNFFLMADHALLRRNSSPPLLSLHLAPPLYYAMDRDEAASFLYSLLVKAHSLQLRHLTIESFRLSDWTSFLRVIFSMDTLQSLRLNIPLKFDDNIFASGINLTSLRCLSLMLYDINQAILDFLLLGLPSMEDLQLKLQHDSMPRLSFSSRILKKLKLVILTYVPIFDKLRLSLPSLESLCLEAHGPHGTMSHCFHGEFPLLRKAVIDLDNIHRDDITAIHAVLNCISHVEELRLHIKENKFRASPSPILFEPGKDAPNFPKLKHLDVMACFHDHNLEAVVTLLHQSPVLESVKLVHEVPLFHFEERRRRREYWESKLPHNDDGNCHYVCCRNLHLGENREGLIKSLSKMHTSMRQAYN